MLFAHSDTGPPFGLHPINWTLAAFGVPQTSVDVLEALEGLHRHSLIERGQSAGSFTLHPLMLEYATTRLISETSREMKL